ncbi:endonuclease/exonuclease/phosphatase family protein [Rhizobium sp. LjRoot30]|uniref:endonuclease/exonuclease/phosphatase family protein n=1 Tax=Rhizobium sp. LjRoot30 TaxID=3342320 RepID=UPI003ECF43C4
MQRKNGTFSSTVLEALRNRKKRPDGSLPSQSHSSGTLVASYNVHKCIGVDRRFDPERTARVIQEIGADVIALQEADQRFGERAGLLDLAHLERETGLVSVGAAGFPKAHGWHGNVVLVRQGVVRDLHPVKLPGLEPRGAVVVEIDLKQGGSLRIIAAHLGLLRRSRAQQLHMIMELMKSRDETPTLLLGDLNEWRLGDRSSLNTLHPAFGHMPPAVPSFPSGLPLLALDRIIANRQGLISSFETHDTPLARLASDHLPVKAVIDLQQAVTAA